MSYFLIGGGFQNVEGIPLANGWLTAELTAPATDLTTVIGICNAREIEYALDSSGNIATEPAQYIWPTDQIQNLTGYKFPYYYRFTAYSNTGALVWGPNYLPVPSTVATSFISSESFVGDGAQQVFDLTAVPIANGLFVYVNGMMETHYVYNSTDNSITLSFAPEIGANITLFYYFDQSVSPVFVSEVPHVIRNDEFSLATIPVSGTLLLYEAGVGEGGLALTLGVDYILSGNLILTAQNVSGTLLAIYQTDTNFTTSRQVTPAGSINGINTTFVLPSVAVPQSIQFFWNGLLQTSGVDYNLSLDNMTITMGQAPATGDHVLAFYNLNAVAIDFSTFFPANPA